LLELCLGQAAALGQAGHDELSRHRKHGAGRARAYDPTLWDTALCGEYEGSLGSAAQPSIEPTTRAVAEPVAEPTKEPTTSQQNAVEKAADYLSSASFSRSGLIKQLKYEGFTTKQATFGTDAQNANWNEQAAKAAAGYLETSSFSRSGLISQLKYEGLPPNKPPTGSTRSDCSAETQILIARRVNR
jgi:hypothetical protein